MIWIFQRDDEVTRLETSFDEEAGDYVLRIVWGQRPEEVERFPTEEAFQTRVEQLEAQLAGDRWIQAGPPMLMPDGWRGPSR